MLIKLSTFGEWSRNPVQVSGRIFHQTLRSAALTGPLAITGTMSAIYGHKSPSLSELPWADSPHSRSSWMPGGAVATTEAGAGSDGSPISGSTLSGTVGSRASASGAPPRGARQAHVVLDFTRGTKGARRERHGLGEELATALSPHFDRVTILYPRDELPRTPCKAGDILGVDTRSDALCEEVFLPLLLKRLQATHVFTFRESLVLPRGIRGHLHLHEDPGIRRSLERAARASFSFKVAMLDWRNERRYARFLGKITSLTTSSYWTLACVRRELGARLPAVRDASVAYLGGFADSISQAEPQGREQRSHALISASRDPRDDLEWALRVYDRGVAGIFDPPRAVVVGISGIARTRRRRALEYAGFVSDDELLRLYRSAVAYIHPSSFEGFGLPLVEAMQCGTPVFAPAGSAVDEVAGHSAYPSSEAAGHDLRQILERDSAWVAASGEAWRRGQTYQWSRCASEIAAHMIVRRPSTTPN